MTTSGVLIVAFFVLLAYTVGTNLVRRAAVHSRSPLVQMLERLRADIADEPPSFCPSEAAPAMAPTALPTDAAAQKPSHVHGR